MASLPAEVQALKRKRFEPSSSVTGSIIAPRMISTTPLLLTGPGDTDAAMDEAVPKDTLLPREFERLSMTINPSFVSKLVDTEAFGFERMSTSRTPTIRYYTLNITHIRERFTTVFAHYLRLRLREQGVIRNATVTTEVTAIVPVVVNACMAAIYARLRGIHRSYQTHAARYTAPPSYNKSLELPLPFADAIQNIGVFTPINTTDYLFCVPTYPENTLNEGRSTQIWSSQLYDSYVKLFPKLKIPVKSVDIHAKPGTSWWTYKYEWVDSHFDLRCTFPSVNYSDHSVLLASMFARRPLDQEDPLQLCEPHASDVLYSCRFRDSPDQFQFRAFTALCHAPDEDWNDYLLIK